jgi:acyl-CoA dehydrogenase
MRFPGVDPDLLDMIDALLQRRSQDTTDFDLKFWNRVTDLGLARVTGSSSVGGSDGSWHDAAALVRRTAYYGIQLPLAEHDLLAGWLLETQNKPSADSMLRTMSVVDSAGVAQAPFARWSDHILVLWQEQDSWHFSDLPTADLKIETVDTPGGPRDRLVDLALPAGAPTIDRRLVRHLQMRSALVRTIQMTGAMERCLDLCLEHAETRQQFGRPIINFQAVQHLIAEVAGEAALAAVAVDRAVTTAHGQSFEEVEFATAVAVSCAGHAASVVVRNAHQVHGAIGTTREHELHRHTLSILGWRSECGPIHEWDTRLGSALVAATDRDVWDLVQTGLPVPSE